MINPAVETVQLNRLYFTLLFLCVLFRSAWSAESLALVETCHAQAQNQIGIPMRVQSVKFTALFNNMRTLKFEALPTNAVFAAVNQVFGGSS